MVCNQSTSNPGFPILQFVDLVKNKAVVVCNQQPKGGIKVKTKGGKK